MALELLPAPGLAWIPRPDLELVALDGAPLAAELAAASARSTPPEHVDHGAWAGPENRLAYWGKLLAGEVCGPVLPQSELLVEPEGGIAGAVILTRLDPTTWWSGGAWVAETFVVPGRQGLGLGRQLLAHSIAACAAAGLPRVGLTVTDLNPAERLYERLGFVRVRSLHILEL